MTKISKTNRLFSYLLFLVLVCQIGESQEYNPTRYYNPLNDIQTKKKNETKTFFEFIQFNRKKKKESCDCADEITKVSYRTNKLGIASTLREFFLNIIRCNKQFGNLAMHVHFSDGIIINGMLDETPFDNGDLNIGMQYFTGNLSYDLWLSAPILDDENQRYGLRTGLSFFPLGSKRIFSPYLGTSFGVEIDYNYENIVQDFEFIENWYTEFYTLARLHAGIQYMFKCKIITKIDVSYAAGSYFDRDGNQFPHYRPWVVWNTIGIRF